MRFLLAGSSGFLGRLLADRLRADGHRVTPLVRREPTRGELRWDPYAADAADRVGDAVAAHDVVVNLAGAPTLGNPHSARWARALRTSRVRTTYVLAEAVANAPDAPVLLAANGVSYYGDHGDAEVSESAQSRGEALLTRVTRAWQDAAGPAVDAGARVVILRTAPVLDRRSQPLRMLRTLFTAGLGGPIGVGTQYFPVISARDWVSAVVHLATHDVAGPANLCCPLPPTNAEFTRTLAAAVHRPAVFRVPARIVRVAAGPMATEVLGSIRAVPQALLDAGFVFHDADVDAVVRTGLAG